MNKKIKKYVLKYTLEFLVIFLGISLSFIINNWNETKKDEALEIKYLKSLKEEYVSNLELFDESFSNHKPRWDNLDRFYKFSTKNSFKEMDSIVAILNINWSFNPNLGATNSLISSGYIELIKNDDIKKLVSRMPFLIDDYTEEEKRTELVCVEMGYYLTEHYVYNPRNNKEKQQLFFKGKNVTFTNAQRDKLAGGAGKGSSVIKNILKKIDNAETLEAANKHRRRFEKLFGVVAPKSTKEKEYINRAGTVDEFGGGKTPPKPKDNPRNKTTSETVSDKQKRDTQLGDKETKKAKAKSEDRRQKNQLNTTKESVKDQILRQGKRKYGKITADSTDEGMSKFSGFDNQKELEAEEEMNFQKGGMPKRKAFGKGGMYKTPKKTYGMSYGGVTRKLKGK